MAVGSINLNTNILNNYSKSNFEHFADGLGKPFNAMESQLDKGLNFLNSIGSKISTMASNALQKLDIESRINKITGALEKGLAAITKIAKMPGQVIGDIFKAVTDGLGKYISAAVNFGKSVLGGLKTAFKGLLNSLGIGKLGKLLEGALKAIIGVLGLPFSFLGKLLNKSKNFIVKLLSPLGGTAKDKSFLFNNLYNENANTFITKASNIFKKGMIVSVLSDARYNTNEELYLASKSFVYGSDYSTVLDSYTSIFKDGSYKNNKNVNYNTVYGWLQKDAENEDSSESSYLKRKFIDGDISGFYNDYEFEFTGRRFMNMSDEEYEKILSGSNITLRAKNESILNKLPSKTSILNDDIDSYIKKNNERINGELDALDKLLIFSPKQVDGYYENKNYQLIDNTKDFFKNSNKNQTITNFNGFKNTININNLDFNKQEIDYKEKIKEEFKKGIKKTTKVF